MSSKPVSTDPNSMSPSSATRDPTGVGVVAEDGPARNDILPILPRCDADDQTFVRNVNLLEILGEEFPEVKPPPDTAARSWSETEIKKYYREERGGDDSGMCAGDDSKKKTETGPEKATPKPPRRPPASHYPIPTLQTLKTWFPGFERANGFGVEGVLPPGLNTDTNSVHNRKPTARVLCWPNAGNAEDLFTNERSRVGGKLVSTPSALLEWSRLNDTHVFAPQLPGRAARGKENGVPSARAAAKQLLDVIGRIFFFDNLGDDSNADSESSSLDTAVPWVVIGHSLGTWLAFEFCALCEKNGFPAPKIAFLSGFPSPDLAFDKRPWRVNSALDDFEFRKECVRWGVAQDVFKPHVWPMFEPLLRSDFSLFDEYEFGGKSDAEKTKASTEESCFPDALRGVSLVTSRGTDDSMITKQNVLDWGRFVRPAETVCAYEDGSITFVNLTLQGLTTPPQHDHHEIQNGTHLFPLDPGCKKVWLELIAQKLGKTFNGGE